MQLKESLFLFIFYFFAERDVIADANILQGAIFHDDAFEESDKHDATESDEDENQNGKDYMWNPLQSRPKKLKSKYKPAAHRVNKSVIQYNVFAIKLICRLLYFLENFI